MPEIASWQWFFNGTAIPGATGPTIVADSSGVYWAYMVDTQRLQRAKRTPTLELYTGTEAMWPDLSGPTLNSNGPIDAADTLLSGIPVNLWQNGNLAAANLSGAAGDFIFSNVPSVNGFVTVDSAALPANWEIIIGQSNADRRVPGQSANRVVVAFQILP